MLVSNAVLQTLVARFWSKNDARKELPMPSAANGLILAGRHTRVTCTVASGHRGPGLSIIWLKGEHDAATVGGLRMLLSVEIASTTNDLIVDLTDVTFMGSSTLRVLVSASSELGQQGRNLSARGTPPCVRRLFELANVAPLPAPAFTPGCSDRQYPMPRPANRDTL